VNVVTRSIALVGLSGSGKSTVGGALAARLGWPLRDTDAMVAAAAGRPVAEIFAAAGESRFRELEAAALAAALDRGPAVVATGGGVVLRPENRALLRARAFVAWLDAPTGVLAARLAAHDEARPLLAGDATARLEAQRVARAPLYAEVADLQIATEHLTLATICDTILAAMR
jgi:shikimate kinase